MKMKIVFKKHENKRVRLFMTIAMIAMLTGSLLAFISGMYRLNRSPGAPVYKESVEMVRDFEAEDYDEDYSVCDVIYRYGDDKMTVSYPYEEYETLDNETIQAYAYETEKGERLYFDHMDPSADEFSSSYRTLMAEKTMPVFNLASSLIILFVSLAVVYFFSGYFTMYEKCWFLSIMVLATIFSVLFPEESANGVNGIWIMLLYLLDTFLNILCELLISKQSKYNFLVSVLVEITEIVMSLVLMYRFATMTVTLLFWLPIDIISYVNWSRHQDEEEEELTKVRKLKGYQEVLVLLGIVVWTVVVGYFISGLDIATDFYHNETLETAVIYIDACASAVGIANGLFIFFRLREQWVAWYICAALEAVINILSGQYVLLILKLGYFTNTTYGYIKWSKYIRTHQESAPSLF